MPEKATENPKEIVEDIAKGLRDRIVAEGLNIVFYVWHYDPLSEVYEENYDWVGDPHGVLGAVSRLSVHIQTAMNGVDFLQDEPEGDRDDGE